MSMVLTARNNDNNLKKISYNVINLPGVVKLLFLLSYASVNLLSNLSKLKLSSKHFVLLLLKSTLSLLKGSLELPFLLLEAATLFVKIMDRASTLTKLIKKILDLVSKILVLTLYYIQPLHSFVRCSLETEEFRAVVTSLVLRGLNLSIYISSLGLPLTKNFVEILASLLSDEGSSMDSLIFHGHVFKLS